MDSNEVVIRRFTTEAEADLVKAILEANGIGAAVLRDDAGGMLPSLAVGSDIRVVVRADDADAAREILEAGDG